MVGIYPPWRIRSLSSHILFLVRKAHHHKISHSLDPHSGARTVVRLRAPSVRFPPSGQTKSPSVFTLGSFVCCPLGGNRTLDHLLKRELLYRLSYERKYYFKKQNVISTRPTGTATTEPKTEVLF